MKPMIFFISLALFLPSAFFNKVLFYHPAPTQAEEPYQDIAVKMYPLTESGSIDTTDPGHPLCEIDDLTTEQNEADTRYGCTAYAGDETFRYPYLTNPATVSLEADYLLDVVPREMGPIDHHDLALQAQAIAARSYAYCAIRSSQGLASWGDCNREINNSNSFQVFVPYYFDTLSADDQTRTQNAVAYLLYMQGSADADQGAIFAEFSADAYLTTVAGDYDYLKSVEDPISYDPAILDIIAATNAHQRGMSQGGANRWAWGSSSQYEGHGTPWPVTWNDYRQILVHYYTGIDILDANSNPVAPDDRWNLLWHDNFGFPAGVPPTLNNAQTYPLQLQLQNTSVSNWAENEITLGYQWTPQGVDPDPAKWLELAALPALAKGDSTPNRDNSPFSVAIPAPCGTGAYTLHLDAGRNGAWFSTAGWPDARIDVTVQLSTPQATAGRGYYTDGLGALYYNDQDDGQWQIGGPITWQTFSPPIVFSTIESFINFDTDTTSPQPGVNGTFWSAVWEGNLYAPQAGQYRFYLGGLDDGGRLEIDDVTYIESWMVQGPHEYFSHPINLAQGLHPFRVEYAQGPGDEAGLSVCWEGPGFAKEVIGASGAIPGQPTPTPFVTPTSVPPATPTNAVTPTSTPPTPEPWGQWFAAEEAALQDDSPAVRETYSNLLSRVRDEIMLPDPKGDAYIRLVYRHAPEITALLLSDATLRQDTRTLMLEARPLLEEMLANKTNGQRLSADWVKRALALLSRVEKKASPELKREILWWRAWLPRFAGKNGREIWEMLPQRDAGKIPQTAGSPEELVLQSIPAEEARAFGSLLSRVRDEVMRGDKGGEVYIALVYRYTPEATALLLNDETLRREAESLLLEAEPGLQSLLGETKDEWVFSSGWLKRMDALLAALQIKGTPDLRAELAIWRTRLPEWEDKTPSQVWEALRLTANSMTVTTPTSTSTVTPTAIP